MILKIGEIAVDQAKVIEGYGLVAGAHIHVYLDGEFQTHCRTANDEFGYIARTVVDAEGKAVRDADGGTKLETVYGHVECHVPDVCPYKKVGNCWELKKEDDYAQAYAQEANHQAQDEDDTRI